MAQKPRIVITDHALLRYLERSLRFDVEHIRQHMIEQLEPAVAVGSTGTWIDDLWAVIRDGTVTSVLPKRPSSLSRQQHSGENHWEQQA